MEQKPKLESPITPEPGWKTIDAPELKSFSQPGEQIAGILVAMASVEVNRKPVVQFTFKGPDGKLFKLLATYDLLQKITRAHVGHPVRIKYRGEDPSVQRNGNAMKVFDVQVREPAAGDPPERDSSPITDEDIPF